MRFFLRLISCYGASHEYTKADRSFSGCMRIEETSNLVNVHPSSGGEKKRHVSGKLGGRGSMTMPVQWRPSLCTISEDDVVKGEKVELVAHVRSCGSNKVVVRSNVVSNSKSNHGALGYKRILGVQDSSEMIQVISPSFLF